MQLTGDGSSRVKLFLGEQGEALSEFHSSEGASAMPRWLEVWKNLSADDRADTAAPAAGPAGISDVQGISKAEAWG